MGKPGEPSEPGQPRTGSTTSWELGTANQAPHTPPSPLNWVWGNLVIYLSGPGSLGLQCQIYVVRLCQQHKGVSQGTRLHTDVCQYGSLPQHRGTVTLPECAITAPRALGSNHVRVDTAASPFAQAWAKGLDSKQIRFNRLHGSCFNFVTAGCPQLPAITIGTTNDILMDDGSQQ